MAEHYLKTWPAAFDAVASGAKRFEYRSCTDRDFNVGDVLVLEKFDPHFAGGSYVTEPGTISVSVKLRARVTYILHGGRFGVPATHCVMSIEREPAP